MKYRERKEEMRIIRTPIIQQDQVTLDLTKTRSRPRQSGGIAEKNGETAN